MTARWWSTISIKRTGRGRLKARSCRWNEGRSTRRSPPELSCDNVMQFSMTTHSSLMRRHQLSPFAFILAALAALVSPAAGATAKAEIVEVRKIWDEGRHNAFTDLIRWK